MTDGVINMSVVAELLDLCDDGDTELIVDLIEMFLEDGPDRVREVREGLETEDWERVERAAHSLKGSSGNLGASKVQDVSEALQLASRLDIQTPDAKRIRQLSEELRKNYDDADRALRELLAQYSR